jgi:RNA polymerase sigma-70 factor (ECF subfamily)
MNSPMAAETANRCELPEVAASRARFSPVTDITLVYETHFRYVWRCLRSLGVPSPQLDDALQDVFLVVQRRLPDFDGNAQLSTWLYAIALRVARKYRARTRRDAVPASDESDAHEELAAPDADQEATLQRSERLLLARAALDALDDEKREVFVLAQVEQMSAPEIASIVGVPVNTVYSRLRAARQAFSAAVEALKSCQRNTP